MRTLLVVDKPDRWPLQVPGVEVVEAQAYLTDTTYGTRRDAVVYNLCRSYAYQRTGYYVSLLAEARGHRPKPSVSTLQDLRDRVVTRIASDALEGRIAHCLARIRSPEFVLSIYFGRPLAQVHEPLARALFDQFPVPLLRARFVRRENEWELAAVGPIAAEDVPESHRPFVVEAAERFFAGDRPAPRRRRPPRYHLALLVDPEEASPPSDEGALKRLERAAREMDLGLERITRDDYARLGEFDGLFIRVTTGVNHYTYRFSRRAEAEGLVVMDDPLSIIRCGNKVFLYERLERLGVPQPKTRIVHREHRDDLVQALGFPCVLKQPDSSFSRGVVKVETPERLEEELDRLLKDSALVVAQEFFPTEYDWRVGVLDKKPLYVCRYFMAPGHWQILKHEGTGPPGFGPAETIPVDQAPRAVIRAAVKAASAMGDGLYGVDLKTSGRRCCVIEVNDNPNIESDVEDRVLGSALYERLLQVFVDRLERRRAASA